ncbi:hypothetical protein DRQ50_14180 [bacterium]|nr:MAG: hypothetical protein DRQ50_14180 [bacterium]
MPSSPHPTDRIDARTNAGCVQRMTALAGLPGPAHAATTALARLLVDDADGPRALVEVVAGRGPTAERLVRALVAPAEPEALLLGRAWKCAGWEHLCDEDRAALQVDNRHQWVPAAIERQEAVTWIEDLRQRMAPLVASRVAGEDLATADLEQVARAVSLDADLWTLRTNRTLTRARERGRDLGDRIHRWPLEASDRQELSRRLERGAPAPPSDRVISRLRRTLGPDRLDELRAELADDADLARLERVLQSLGRDELAVPDPERGLGLLLDLARAPGAVSLMAADPDPLLMAAFVLERGRRGVVAFPLPAGRGQEALQAGMKLPAGVVLGETTLEVDCGAALLATEADNENEKGPRKNTGNSAIKEMVLGSMQSTSAILAFLRDPKVAAIPGLVEEVVVRTRNPQVLATIATDRTLHGGFANRGVPLALLRSPVNVSIKTIRRFIHVKYAAKIELKRMAIDTSGIRQEVNREVIKYLDSLT